MTETWQIIAAVGVLVVGIGVGMLLRPSNKKLRQRADELETELSETRERLESHRSEVSKHFEQTSDLFRDLTQQYTTLYAHLAEGARTLVPERMLEISQGFNMAALQGGGLAPEEKPVVEDETPAVEVVATPESTAEVPTLDEVLKPEPSAEAEEFAAASEALAQETDPAPDDASAAPKAPR